MKAVPCPICKGEGQVCIGIAVGTASIAPMLERCHGCKGSGWIIIAKVIRVPPKGKVSRA